MSNETKHVESKTQDQLPEEWQQRAREAASQYGLPMPSVEEIGSPQEVERRLRQAEQEGGE